MALTVDALKAALHLGLDDAAYDEELSRLIAVATAQIERYAPAAPQAVKDRAVSVFAEYLHDRPTGTGYLETANVFSNSGARSMLSYWRERRAGLVE